MIPGQVANVRELRGGVQASVCIGSSGSHGYVTCTILGHSPEVKAALSVLKHALVDEAHAAILAAQATEQSRGHRAIGAA